MWKKYILKSRKYNSIISRIREYNKKTKGWKITIHESEEGNWHQRVFIESEATCRPLVHTTAARRLYCTPSLWRKEKWVYACNICVLISLQDVSTLESPLDCKEIKPVNPKGNHSWIVIGRANPEAETPILWSPDMKNWLIRKDPGAGKDWRQEEKGMTEDEMVGWHYQLNGHEFEQALGGGDGQWGLGCCSPWGHKRVGHKWATELNLYLCKLFKFISL